MNTNPMIFVWLCIALLFLLWEMGSPGLFYFVSFFFGAVIAAGVSFFSENIVIQSVLFLLSSVIAFWCLRHWVKQENKDGHRTNVSALLGKQGLVIKEISRSGSGAIKVSGEIWSAYSVNNEIIPQGTLVEVIRVQGAHLIVIERSH